MTRNPIGYQFALDGTNIAGDANDPTEGWSYEVIHPRDKAYWEDIAKKQGLTLQPIFDGDIEDFNYLPPAPRFYTVSIFLIDKQYGGPEEGGWYYTYGDRCDEYPPLVATTKIEANALRYQAQQFLDADENAGRPSISSSNSRGKYVARVYPNYPPTHFPERRPHYE